MKIFYAINNSADFGIGYIAQQHIEGLKKLDCVVIDAKGGGAVSDEMFDEKIRDMVRDKVIEPDVAIIWANHGLETLKHFKKIGIPTILVRASTHIDHQNMVLTAEQGKRGILRDSKDTAIKHHTMKRMREEYELADMIFVSSDQAAKTFPEELQPKVRTTYFGVNSSFFKPLEDTEKDKGFNIGFVGVNTLRKGLPYLNEAMGLLPKKGNKFNLKLGMGQMPFWFMPKYYNSLDVFVQPSLEEGNSLVVGEALACGIPVIATTECGLWPEWFTQQPGLTVKAGDSQAIADAIMRVKDSPEKTIADLGKNGRAVAEKNSWERYSKELLEMCEEAVNGT